MPSSNTTSDGGGLEPLSEKVANELTLSIQVFGTELVMPPQYTGCLNHQSELCTHSPPQVQCVHAKQFRHREEAIGNVRAALESCDPQLTSKRDVINLFKAAGEMLKKLLNDKVTSVSCERCWK